MMLALLIARHTMHQNQRAAVVEEFGGPEEQLPGALAGAGDAA
jgi:hypothetical protein